MHTLDPCSAGALAWRLAASTLGQAASPAAAATGALVTRAASAAGVAPSTAARLLSNGGGTLPRSTAAFSSLAASALAAPTVGTARMLLLSPASAPLRRSGLAAALAGADQPVWISRAALPQLLQTAGLRHSAAVGWAAKKTRDPSSGDASGDGVDNSLRRIGDEEQDAAVQEERRFKQWLDGLKQQGYHVDVVVEEVQQWVQGQPLQRAVKRTVQYTKTAWVDWPFLKRTAVWMGVFSALGLLAHVSPDVAGVVGSMLFFALWLASLAR